MNIDVEFKETSQTFSTAFKDNIVIEVVGEHETYDGEYAVTPTVQSQTLPTKKKVMAEDVTIKEIPYFDVSNNAGGSTVYIGNEVE